ncbi:MAG: carbohydrate ABC transporter permease [Acholeplasmatales bacterium]|nr:MAG: carbohydrate ABC transporter permease [Acholeplasmatales bacterium]
MLLPYIWMALTALKTPSEAFSMVPTFLPEAPQFHNFRRVLTEFPFWRAVSNTMIVELSVISVGTIVSALAAFSFAKLRMPYKKTLLLMLLSSMMVPYATVMLPQYRAFQALGMVDTLWPIILPGLFGNAAMMFFLIQYMRGIPDVLIESAKIDGASYLGIFVRIIIPLSKPALAAQVIFWFVGIWNDYFAPSIYLTSPRVQTLQVLIASLNSTYASGTNFPLLMAAATLSSIPMILIFLFFQRYFLSTVILSGVKE